MSIQKRTGSKILEELLQILTDILTKEKFLLCPKISILISKMKFSQNLGQLLKQQGTTP